MASAQPTLFPPSNWAFQEGGLIRHPHPNAARNLSVQVGELDYDCRSTKTQWGTQTMYQTWTEVTCGGNGGIPNPGDPPPWYPGAR
jgi:hypothetical protein